MRCPECHAPNSTFRAFFLPLMPLTCVSCGALLAIARAVQLLMVAAFSSLGAFKPWQTVPLLNQYPWGVGFALFSVLAVTVAGLASIAGAVQVDRHAKVTGPVVALFLLLLGVIVAGFLVLALLGHVT